MVTGTTGNAIAELLLGPGHRHQRLRTQVNFRHQYCAIYVEDTAKVTPKLTVTYGLRYSIEGADVSSGNELSYLDTTSASPLDQLVPSMPNLTGGVGIVGLSGASRTLQVPGKTHFDPRLGIAYSLNDKTVFHGGFGVFYHPTATWGTNPASFGFTRKSTSIDAAANGFSPLLNLSNPFPNGLPAPYGNNPTPLAGSSTAGGPLSVELGQNISGNLRKQSDAYQEIWSLDVQRALPAHFAMTSPRRTPAPAASTCSAHSSSTSSPTRSSPRSPPSAATVANPFFNVITDSSSVLSKSTVQAGYLMHAYPQFTGFEALNAGWGHSNYEAAQLTVEHHMNRGLSMVFAYTWSKSIDDVGESGTSASIQDNGCHRCERSIADLDQTNIVRLSTVYELPLGPNKKFLTSGIAGYLAGGWQLGGTFQYNTGQPLQLTSPALLGTGLLGSSVMRPTVVPGQSITAKVTSKSGQVSSFNPAAFVETGEFAFGNAPRYLSNVRFPAFSELDIMLQKQTRITERTNFTIRFEALNALNTVVFGTPDVGVADSNFGYNFHTQANAPRIAQLQRPLHLLNPPSPANHICAGKNLCRRRCVCAKAEDPFGEEAENTKHAICGWNAEGHRSYAKRCQRLEFICSGIAIMCSAGTSIDTGFRISRWNCRVGAERGLRGTFNLALRVQSWWHATASGRDVE